EDHCAAIARVLEAGLVGRAYNIGGHAERTNLEVVGAVCSILDALVPRARGTYAGLITYVTDRPGHDFRYAIDCSRIENELGWKPAHEFESGLRETVQWYLDNGAWVDHVRSGAYRDWLAVNYGQRNTSEAAGGAQ
ncbi:MAG: GDP-mannose 4,6-dehydratase, partial [Desulfovibrio sp.]|nr:GDP-mannose 4,6-dehydratase [Desulfovibrio sp.]